MMERLMGVITLKAPMYRKIADDKSLTGEAAMIVVLVSALAGFVGALLGGSPDGKPIGIVGAVLMAVVAVIVALIGWVIGAWLTAFVAKTFFQGKTNTSEMMRVTGFTKVFGILGVIPILGIVGVILSIIGNVIGIREAAEFDTMKAILTAVIAGVIVFLVVGALTAVLVGIVLVAGGAMGG